MNYFSQQYGKDAYMDMVNIISLVVDLMNLQENLTQSDKQEIVNGLNKSTEFLLTTLNEHLELQDKKIDKILSILENCNLLAQ